jgi:putative transposase
LQDVLTRLDRAFQAFFRRVRNGEKPGYPRFQGRNRYHSFTYKQYGSGARLDNGFLVLSKIGRVAVRWSRPLEGTPKTVTISQEADGWYASISCAEVPAYPLPPTGQETGIDVGLKVFLVTAQGVQVANPRYLGKAERYLAKCHRRVAKRQMGSHRRAKAVKILAKAYQTVACQRRDFLHKTALALVREHDLIYLEDLPVANLVRNRHLAKSISDAGWAAFRTILEGKAVYAGRRVVVVSPAFTTQECSNPRPDGTICGERVKKSLSVRTHQCLKCGFILDRDENAARNIQWAGQALRGLAGMPAGLNRESPVL